MFNRRTHEKGASTSRTRERSASGKVIGTLTGVALLASVTAGCTAETAASAPRPSETTVTTKETTPAAKPVLTPEEIIAQECLQENPDPGMIIKAEGYDYTAELLPDFAEVGVFDCLTPEQQTEIIELNKIDVPTFRALPGDQQLRFADLVRQNLQPIQDFRFGENGIDAKYVELPTSPEDRLGNMAYLESLIYATIYMDSDGVIHYDGETAKKIVSLFTGGDSTNPFIKDYDNAIDTLGGQVGSAQGYMPNKLTGSSINEGGSLRMYIEYMKEDGTVEHSIMATDQVIFIGYDGREHAAENQLAKTADPAY